MSEMPMPPVSQEDIRTFAELIDRYRYDFCKLVYILFPFGEPGSALEHMRPYDWQMEEWRKLSVHLSNPLTRHSAYRLAVSSGNGAAKTAFGAMTTLMLMYTQKLRGRITANTKPQMTSVIWPEYDVWFRHARYHDYYFEKLGESIKARKDDLAETWRLDAVTWNAATPASISGLHNKGGAILYTFEEAPGIDAIIWQYASGAMTDTDTIKIWLAFGNSDDPESKFEQVMNSPDWHSLRIDTRTLSHVDPEQIATWLRECNGDEDHDDFRVRVRGLPRKSAKDSIIDKGLIMAALQRGVGFDVAQVSSFPVYLMCDPAWQGGDETTIWYCQGNYARLLDRYKLNKEVGEDHSKTYYKLVEYESLLKADLVLVDQGEGTAIKTMANGAGKYNWELISFGSNPNDQLDPKESQFANMRAQMMYGAKAWLQQGGVLDARKPEWREDIEKELSWTKGTRHKITGKKLAEAKSDIKLRVGKSPDVADGFILRFSRELVERLEEHRIGNDRPEDRMIGERAYKMPEMEPNYDESYQDLYR